MSRRGVIAGLMVLAGLLLMVVSYFRFAAPWGFPPSSDLYSNPRVEWAAAWFVLGVMLAFLSAVVYEILPEGGRKGA